MAVLLGFAVAMFVFGLLLLATSKNAWKATKKVELGRGVAGNRRTVLPDGKPLIRPCWRNMRARE